MVSLEDKLQWPCRRLGRMGTLKNQQSSFKIATALVLILIVSYVIIYNILSPLQIQKPEDGFISHSNINTTINPDKPQTQLPTERDYSKEVEKILKMSPNITIGHDAFFVVRTGISNAFLGEMAFINSMLPWCPYDRDGEIKTYGQ